MSKRVEIKKQHTSVNLNKPHDLNKSYCQHKYPLLKEILVSAKEALLLLKKKPKYLALSAVSDLLFFFFYGFILSKLFNKTTEYMYAFANKMTLYSLQNPMSPPFSMAAISETGASGLLLNIILLFILIIISIYFIYCFFQGFSWAFARKIIDGKTDNYKFVSHFFFINLFWFGLYLIYKIINYGLSLSYMLRTKAEASPTGVFSIALLCILAYFAFISYSLQDKNANTKTVFRFGIRRFPQIILSYIFVILVFVLLDLILKLISFGGAVLFVVCGIILLPTAFLWARIYLMQAMGKLYLLHTNK